MKEANEIYNLVKIFIVTLLVFLIVLLLTFFTANKERTINLNNEAKEMQYTYILENDVLKQKENEYYVVYMPYTSNLNSIVSYYLEKLDYYYVDTESKFNSSNDELKVIKVEDGEVTKEVTEFEEVFEYLKEVKNEDKSE